MIKFWIVDFSYEKRLGHSEPFGYVFHVSGESANYLMNKYRLSYPRVFVNCYLDKTIYIGSRQHDGRRSDCCDCNNGDREELYNLLFPIIQSDLANHEEYMCDDSYDRDSRWE